MNKQIKAKNTKVTNTNVKQVFPFQIVEHENKFYITVGNNVMTEKTFKSNADAEKYIKSKPYELIINVCCFAMEMNNKQKEKETQK